MMQPGHKIRTREKALELLGKGRTSRRQLRDHAKLTLSENSRRGQPCENAPEQLHNYFVTMFASGLMTAGALTNLAMMITRAGGQGLEDLAKDPTSLGRNAARILQTRVGIKAIIAHLLLHIQVPLQTKRGIKASRQPLPILPIYGVFAARWDEKKKQYMKHLEQPDLFPFRRAESKYSI